MNHQQKKVLHKQKDVHFVVRCSSIPLFSFRVLLLVCKIDRNSITNIIYLATILPDLAGHHFKQPYGKEYGK